MREGGDATSSIVVKPPLPKFVFIGLSPLTWPHVPTLEEFPEAKTLHVLAKLILSNRLGFSFSEALPNLSLLMIGL